MGLVEKQAENMRPGPGTRPEPWGWYNGDAVATRTEATMCPGGSVRLCVFLGLLVASLFVACSDRNTLGDVSDGGVDAALPSDASDEDTLVVTDTIPQEDATSNDRDGGQLLVQCGTSQCDLLAHQVCCVTSSGVSCVSEGSCSGYGTLTCDGPEDCVSGDTPVCCGRVGQSGGGTACVASTGCSGNGAVRLCHEDQDCIGGERCCGSISALGLELQYCLPEAQCPSPQPTPGVSCGTTSCFSPDVCCIEQTGASCVSASVCQDAVAFACDGPEDCEEGGAGLVCCVDIQYQGGLSGGATCTATCNPSGLIGGVVCHSDADCPSGQSCRWVGYGGYGLNICRS